MDKIVINPSDIGERYTAHKYLAEIFSFPQYYGNNLNALFDCLTDIAEPTYVTFNNTEALNEYGKMVYRVFTDASKKNKSLILE